MPIRIPACKALYQDHGIGTEDCGHGGKDGSGISYLRRKRSGALYPGFPQRTGKVSGAVRVTRSTGPWNCWTFLICLWNPDYLPDALGLMRNTRQGLDTDRLQVRLEGIPAAGRQLPDRLTRGVCAGRKPSQNPAFSGTGAGLPACGSFRTGPFVQRAALRAGH